MTLSGIKRTEEKDVSGSAALLEAGKGEGRRRTLRDRAEEEERVEEEQEPYEE